MKKRFIAGVVCPACGLPDKTYVLKSESSETRHCLNCGHKEEKSQDQTQEWQPIRIEKEP